jgi:2-oxoglutarate dehydrogenase E2 component (dihydrolipoamide succinyltransferase)
MATGIAAFAVGLGLMSVYAFSAVASSPRNAAPMVVMVPAATDTAAIVAAIRAALPPAPVAVAATAPAPVAVAAPAAPARRKVRRTVRRPAPVAVYYVATRCGCG